LLQAHNFVGFSDNLKIFTYQTMVQLCSDEDNMDQIAHRLQKVEKDVGQWKTTPAQRRDLYTTVARALDKINDTV
jgi:hypothetical protein